MSVQAVLQRAAVLCYYLVLGTLGDAVLLAAWFLWTRGSFVIRLIGVDYTEIFVILSVWNGPGWPLLFPCQTTHTRLFPKKHSFVYSYLLVGIPVGWTGAAGGMISNDEHGTGASGWYKIDAADYLERGSGHLGLRGKLNAYLESQGVDASRYPYAYLVTAAKFLGYHFNPVSFWYLYSANKTLAAIILEVNNTFDERRMYFLTTDDMTESIEAPEDSSLEGDTRIQQSNDSKPLRRTWPKDFHVSPFNSRKGAYSLVAHDPLAPNMQGQGPIDNTINLISSKDHAKLVARIFSDGDAIDPMNMTFLEKFQFLASWWWVGFVTFPRILKEATLLFFQRKLHVWYRPEPLKTSIGRHADKTERVLEPIFRRYLKHLVEQTPESLSIKYIPSGIADAPVEIMVSASAAENPSPAEEMEFKVLTPAFYSRFVYYAHDFEAIFSELKENNTIWVSNAKLLPKLFVKKDPPLPLQTASYLDYGYFMAIKKLRQRPERLERPLTSSQTSTTTCSPKDIRGFRLSSMDGYVLAHEDSKTRGAYRNSVLKLFIADRIALGNVDVLQLEHWILRLLLAWVAMS
ncbi:hypothetical protein F5Y06DRAFT_306060 [Hypoxylon sp. FL0890]|nr:hypothetical protein F5Y06DRAFT_306060 [Hypoxylon sp. FL0890]